MPSARRSRSRCGCRPIRPSSNLKVASKTALDSWIRCVSSGVSDDSTPVDRLYGRDGLPALKVTRRGSRRCLDVHRAVSRHQDGRHARSRTKAVGTLSPARSVDRGYPRPSRALASRCQARVRSDPAPHWLPQQGAQPAYSRLPFGSTGPQPAGRAGTAGEESPASIDLAASNGKQFLVIRFRARAPWP